MDDFDYSVQISDLDWDSFLSECEGCALVPATVASSDASGMSDADDVESSPSDVDAGGDCMSDGTPDCDGLSVERYISICDPRGPADVLSGSEEGTPLEAVNKFFERLKSLADSEEAPTHSLRVECKETEHSITNLDKEFPKDSTPVKEPESEWTTNQSSREEKQINPQDSFSAGEGGECSRNGFTSASGELTVHEAKVDVMVNERRRGETKLLSETSHILESSDYTVSSIINSHELPFIMENTVCCTHNPQQESVQGYEEVSNEQELQRNSYENQANRNVDNGTLNVKAEAPSSLMRCNVTKARKCVKATYLEKIYDRDLDIRSSEFKNTYNDLSLAAEPGKVLVDKKSVKRCESVLVLSLNNDSPDSPTSDVRTTGVNSAVSMRQVDRGDVSLPSSEEPFLVQCTYNALGSTKLRKSSESAEMPGSVACLCLEDGVSVTGLEGCTEEQTDILAEFGSVSQQFVTEPGKTDIPTQQDQEQLESGQYLETYPQDTNTVESTRGICAADQKESLTGLPNNHDIIDVPSPMSNLSSAAISTNEALCVQMKNMMVPGPSVGHNLQLVSEELLCYSSPQIEFKRSTVTQSNIETTTVPTEDCKAILDLPVCSSESSDDGNRSGTKTVLCMFSDPDNSEHNQTYTKKRRSFLQSFELSVDNSNGSEKQTYSSESSTNSKKHSPNHTHEDIATTETPKLGTESILEEQSFEKEPVAGPKAPEEEDVGVTSEPTHGVYAISCFWDEMEKLTINDILQLKLVANAQNCSLYPHPQGSYLMNAADTADSTFFTQLRDSKPEHSRGDMSTMSDFEDKLSMIDNTNGMPILETRNPELHNQTAQLVVWESGPGSSDIGQDNFLKDESGTQDGNVSYEHLVQSNTQHCFRNIYKNISVQNLPALEVEPRLSCDPQDDSVLATAVVHKQEDLTFKVTEHTSPPMESYSSSVASPPPLMPADDFVDNTITFPEIFEYFFTEGESEARLLNKTSYDSLSTYGHSVPETYDHFFSELDTGKFFLPMIQGDSNDRDDPVPIFSRSRSFNRTLNFEDEYDFFFPDNSPVVSDDEDTDHTPVKVVTDMDHRETVSTASAPDMYENFFADTDCAGDLFWRHPFSLRRIRLLRLVEPRKNSESWAVTTNYRDKRECVMARWRARGHSSPHVYQLETWFFQQTSQLMRTPTDLQTTLADPRADRPLLSLRQSDMCLICIAFASWVLRSTIPQAGDTWKAALLANISALSAIRYLRRCVREKKHPEKP